LPQKKPRGAGVNTLIVLLLVVLVVLAAANLVVAPSGRSPVTVVGIGLSAEQTRELASKLAQRSLYPQAAAAWQDYLAAARLTGPEQAKTHFQIGTLLEKAGRYAEAIEHYYRSEMTAAVKELEPDINARVKECFEKLGKFSALRYEVMDRTSLKASPPAGGKIVAQIGAEKITEAQLDARIEESIEDQLAPMRAFMTPEQISEQKKRALEQARSPKARQEFLQGWLAQEILYRQALQDQLSDKPEVQRVVHELTRQALSQQLMNEQLAAKIHVTDSDLQTYYAAHKDQYVEPQRARISHILVGDQGQANDLLKRLQEDADFAALAQEFSLDGATKNTGGRVAEEVLPGAYVPGIGDGDEINASIFAAQAPAVLEKAFQTDKGWEIVKVEEKYAQRQKGFDEVRQQVTMQLLRQKREEVQRQYLQEMMDRHQVIVHTSAFAPAPQDTSQETPSKP